MCAIFGLLDPIENLSRKEKQRIIQALGWEAQIRGTDATGLAWVEKGHIGIRKAPCAARRFAFRFPGEAKVLMGHPRMTTQGSEKQNQNNHPFPGKAGASTFALAHNGMLHNDRELRRSHRLPGSRVQTDSYVAGQLLEEAGEISHTSLAAMAEELEGSFTFTVLTDQNSLFFLKGNNPLSLWHFPESGVYLYASTEEILTRTAARVGLRGKKEKVLIRQGQILEIDSAGQQNGVPGPQGSQVLPGDGGGQLVLHKLASFTAPPRPGG